MLAGFMEERNILWGELVGGLLIVGCSIALVISLWQTLEEIPYFPFLIFAAITAALFGAGLYTLSHWKLEATSRGLLVIATLLTPLDFLVLAGLSQGRPASVLDWGTELFALIAFTALVLRSSRILVGQKSGDGTQDAGEGKQATGDGIRRLAGRLPSDASLLTFAVVGASATQLLVPRWLDLAQPVTWLFVLLSLAPVILQALAAGAVLAKLAWRGPLDERRVNKLYLFLGPTVFAVVVALGFIVYWSEHPIWALRHLAVPIAVAAWPLLVCGAFVHDRLVSPPQGGETVPEVEGTLSHGLSPALARLVGTVIALVGAGIMLGALALGWPRPAAADVDRRHQCCGPGRGRRLLPSCLRSWAFSGMPGRRFSDRVSRPTRRIVRRGTGAGTTLISSGGVPGQRDGSGPAGGLLDAQLGNLAEGPTPARRSCAHRRRGNCRVGGHGPGQRGRHRRTGTSGPRLWSVRSGWNPGKRALACNRGLPGSPPSPCWALWATRSIGGTRPGRYFVFRYWPF